MTALLFGKLPAHGDFVARGLGAEARERLDAWLSASLADARETLGDGFADRFDAALPWRCTGPGVAGAIAASQDAAGRRFPVLLLCADDEGAAERCEALLYAAIGERWPADRLADAAGDAPGGEPAVWYGGSDRYESAAPPDLVSAMLR